MEAAEEQPDKPSKSARVSQHLPRLHRYCNILIRPC